MKIMKKLLLLFTVLSMMGCSNKQPETVSNNLITNPSFEDANGFSFQDWHGVLTSSSTDTPGNGGNYALQIDAPTHPFTQYAIGYAETYVTGLQGAVLLHFSCDVKVNPQDSPGVIIISKNTQNGVRTELNKVLFDNAQWHNVSFDINTVLAPTDSLIICLSHEMIFHGDPETILFDNVTLTE